LKSPVHGKNAGVPQEATNRSGHKKDLEIFLPQKCAKVAKGPFIILFFLRILRFFEAQTRSRLLLLFAVTGPVFLLRPSW
jgi:hypothetical protein